MADSLFGSLSSGLQGLFGGSDSLWNTVGAIGDTAMGAYDLYQGIQSQNQYNDFMGTLGASYAKSDALAQAMYDRAKETYFPIEDLQAQYALEDLERYRPLQVNQQQYGIDRGNQQIGFAQNTMDPLEDSFLTFLSQGADPQKYRNIASADIQQGFDQASADTARAMARQGINPNSGAFADMMKQTQLGKAAAEAGARTEASRLAEDLDIARKGQALNYWKGIPFDTTTAPTSGSNLASQATSALTSTASGLANAAKLANNSAGDYFAGATATFGNIGDYLNSNNNRSRTSTASSGGILGNFF